MTSRVSIDVGGTFTDVVVLGGDGNLRFDKVSTTPADPALGVLSGFERAGVSLRASINSPTARRWP